MYTKFPQFVFGFHGCDKQTAEAVISEQKLLNKSENTYDWLGNGIYFWENNYLRALEFAKEKKTRGFGSKKIQTPAVIGAIIDLGHCLNLLETDSLQMVKVAHDLYKQSQENAGYPLPENKSLGSSEDLLLRHLDCAVIESIHTYNKDTKETEYDSVRGVFFEGPQLYKNSGFREKNHIQICIRNPNCIKGFFYPRSIDNLMIK